MLSALYSTLQPVKESFQIDKQIIVTGHSKGEAHNFMLATWTLILAFKKGELPDGTTYPSKGCIADLLSVFDGPDGTSNIEA